LNPRKKDS